MGAKCSSGTSKSPNITFVAVDGFDGLQVIGSLRLRPGEVAKHVASIEYFIEEIGYSQSSFYGGRCPIRPMVSYAYKTTDGLVYVVDSTDEDKIQDGLSKLNEHILKDDETRNMVIMILANNQDEEGALPLKHIESKVGEILASHGPKMGGRTLVVRGCNSKTKAGLEEAFFQFTQILQLHKGGLISPGLQTFREEELQNLGKKDNNSRFHSLKKIFDMSYMKSVLLY